MNAVYQRVKERFDYHFRISESGVYSIAIAARCRSGTQIGKRGGEDLRVEIDGRAFREIPPVSKPQYYDIPVSWSGTTLKDVKKTVVFILYLNAGAHIITFIPREGASIEEEPVVSRISEPADVLFDLEEQAEDGDRRPWVAFALIDLPVASFSIDASVKWHWGDSDDIKLIIDGAIQKNAQAILHRNWLWSGSIFKKLFQSERQEKTLPGALPKGTHYIELWADRTPILHRARFNLGQINFSSHIEAKVAWEDVVFRAAPSTDAKELATVHKEETVIILEKALQGERVRNPNGVLLSTNRWHRVRHQGQEGYVYSLALEIEGEDRRSIEQTIIAEARATGIDPEIVLALADCESNMLPYTVSFLEGEPEVAFGVMQLTGDLIKDLNNQSKSFYGPVNDVFDIQQNVRGGVRYFHYLYNTVYGDSRDILRKAVAAYNAGRGNVPADQPFNLGLYGGQTKRMALCVDGHIKKKTFQKILSRAKTVGFIVVGLVLSLWFYEELAGPAIGMALDRRSAGIAQTVTHHNEIWLPSKFPGISLDRKNKQLVFFNQSGKRVKQTPIDRLNSAVGSQATADTGYVFIDRGVLEFPDNTFYFSATDSSRCDTNSYGGANCTYSLYRFDNGRDELRLMREDLSGLGHDFYLSPDASKLAIVRTVMTSICAGDDYLTILDLTNLSKKEFDVIGERGYYDINAIRSLRWDDNGDIVIDIERLDQNGCSTDKPKPPREENKVIILSVS